MILQGQQILLTGGSGRLGCQLTQSLDGIVAPSSSEMDITKPQDISEAIDKYQPLAIVHAGAYTDVSAAENDRQKCWAVNVEGTHNIVRAASEKDIFLVHISTDYVFDGTRGMYTEDDTPGPAINYYALTKLVAEQLAHLAKQRLVIRTSFRDTPWPYPQAFTDVYTSQDYVEIIAPQIALAVRHCLEIPFNTLHIATERKTAYEFALRSRPDVKSATKSQANVAIPSDTSLDVSRWQRIKAQWSK